MLHLPLPLAVGLSDARSRPLRSTLTALGLGAAVLTLTSALTFNATLRTFLSDLNVRLVDGDLFLYPSFYLPEAQVRRLVAEQPDVSAPRRYVA